MTRTLLAVAVLTLAGCGGTDESGLECNTDFPTLDGAHAMSIEGECSGGTVTLTESAIPDSCGHALAATWTCGTRSGSDCARARSFRYENYVEVALCDGPTEFWYIGPAAAESFAF